MQDDVILGRNWVKGASQIISYNWEQTYYYLEIKKKKTCYIKKSQVKQMLRTRGCEAWADLRRNWGGQNLCWKGQLVIALPLIIWSTSYGLWCLLRWIEDVCPHKNLDINVGSGFIVITKSWKQLRCPSVGEWNTYTVVHIGNKLMKGKGRGIHWEIRIETYTLLHIK